MQAKLAALPEELQDLNGDVAAVKESQQLGQGLASAGKSSQLQRITAVVAKMRPNMLAKRCVAVETLCRQGCIVKNSSSQLTALPAQLPQIVLLAANPACDTSPYLLSSRGSLAACLSICCFETSTQAGEMLSPEEWNALYETQNPLARTPGPSCSALKMCVSDHLMLHRLFGGLAM